MITRLGSTASVVITVASGHASVSYVLTRNWSLTTSGAADTAAGSSLIM